MDLKILITSLFTLLLLLTIFIAITSYAKLVTYVEKLPTIREDVFIIHSYGNNSIYIAKYIIYELSIYDSILYKPRLRVDHILSNKVFNEIGVKNISIEIGFSNSNPVLLPKTLLSIGEYNVLIRDKYRLEKIYSGLGNTTIYSKTLFYKYLITVITISIDENTYIDFSKYIPAIIYYPRELVLNTSFAKLLEYSINDTVYSSILKYSINTLVNEYCTIETSIEYTVYPITIDQRSLFIMWIILLILIEYRKPGVTLIYAKKLFYKLLFSLNYILKKLRLLIQYIQKLSRV